MTNHKAQPAHVPRAAHVGLAGEAWGGAGLYSLFPHSPPGWVADRLHFLPRLGTFCIGAVSKY